MENFQDQKHVLSILHPFLQALEIGLFLHIHCRKGTSQVRWNPSAWNIFHAGIKREGIQGTQSCPRRVISKIQESTPGMSNLLWGVLSAFIC